MKDKKTPPVLAAVGLTFSIGLNIAACILVGTFMGKFLDGYFGTAPWITIIGVVFGMLSGLWVTYKRIINLGR